MNSQGLQDDKSEPISIEMWKVNKDRNRSRKQNDELRGRKNLYDQEIKEMCKEVRNSCRYPDRDELLFLLIYNHGLRISEAVNFKWQYIDLNTRQVRIKRLKKGIDTTHPISSKREMMLLTRLYKAQNKPSAGHLFITERNTVMSCSNFQKKINKISKAVLGIPWNAHALRHACGTTLIDKDTNLRTVQSYLGHKNIQNTVIYTHLSSKSFSNVDWD